MRPKPEPSEDLYLLRAVLILDKKDDPKGDVGIARYREIMTSEAGTKWVMQRASAAEKEYRDELAAWHKEAKEEAAARKAAKEASKETERPLEPCEIVARRFLEDCGVKIDQLMKAIG